jgi:NAD(P)-dependent dehydrogenase (short-subunit alcohol dehydrogenase family)
VAKALAAQEYQPVVIIHGRNRNKLDKVVEELKNETGNNRIEGYVADLSALDEVRRLADAIMHEHDRINVLINNAGAGFAAPRFGKDRTETRFTVNYLAPFLLTNLLLPVIKKAAPSRIVNVSSAGQSPIQFNDIMMDKRFDGVAAYTQSKLALVMFTIDLAGQLKNDDITVNALHPGTYLDTNMVREAGIRPYGTAQSGADAIVYLATAPELKTVTGNYFNVGQITKALSQAYDTNARKRLRDLTLKLTGPINETEPS